MSANPTTASKTAPAVPRWLVRTIWLAHRAAYRVTGNASDADTVRRPETFTRAASQGDGDRFGDFAVLGDECRIDASQIDFRRGRVADCASHEVRRAAGNVGDARGETLRATSPRGVGIRAG